jgi:broad specificity phosphatase PhoE
MRHGETDWNTQGKIQGGGYDIPLNENGKRQAEKAAAELDGIPLSIIASSSLSRAKETADILYRRHINSATNHGLPPPIRVVDAGFNEMRFGDFEGFAYHDAQDAEFLNYFKKVSKQTKQDISFCFPGGGESTEQVMQRSTRALNELMPLQQQQEEGTHIAVVSHGRSNKILIAATALGDVRRTKELAQSNTAINVMDYDAKTGVFTPVVLNHYEHVKDHVIERGAFGDHNTASSGAKTQQKQFIGAIKDSSQSTLSTTSPFLASSPSTTAPNKVSVINFDSVMKEVDHVANRVGLCTLAGFFGGAAWATVKGFPRRSTALSAGGSCAIVATSLFATERLANAALRSTVMPSPEEETRLNLSSYAFSGIVGGGLNGYLYQKKPARGMFVFVPLMFCVAGLEMDWKRRKEARMRQIQDSNEV